MSNGICRLHVVLEKVQGSANARWSGAGDLQVWGLTNLGNRIVKCQSEKTAILSRHMCGRMTYTSIFHSWIRAPLKMASTIIYTFVEPKVPQYL